MSQSLESSSPAGAAFPIDLVTGGTGMLGSHIIERLVAKGRGVRALVREGSDTSFLKTVGVELMVGDLTDPGALPARSPAPARPQPSQNRATPPSHSATIPNSIHAPKGTPTP